MDCLFCRIIQREIPATIILETDDIIVIKDIAPQAPVHYLVMPKKHISDLRVVSAADRNLLGNLLLVVQQLSQKLPAPQAFRLISNNGTEVGQSVDHIHFHVLAGQPMSDF